LAETNHDPAVAGKNLEIVVMVKNSRKIFPKLKPNIQIGGIIFQIYRPISRKILHLLTLISWPQAATFIAAGCFAIRRRY